HVHEYSKMRYVVFPDIIGSKAAMEARCVPPEEGWVRVKVELHLDLLVVANTLQSRDIGSARGGWSAW
ncbi:hypothetical protein A2U01_0015826, partial [Trifolium medium]|nr:hypothetical protein [Trifolium medium]